jgi:hypothetical protein
MGAVESGVSYTRTAVYDAATEAPTFPLPLEETFSSRAKVRWTVDLSLQKSIRLSKSYSITPFLLVRNLFDVKNEVFVYSGSGSPETTDFLTATEGQMAYAGYEDVYTLKERHPFNYDAPRQIFFGLRAEF